MSVPGRLLVWCRFLLHAVSDGFTPAALAGALPAFLPQCFHSLWFSTEHCVSQPPITICPAFTGHGYFCFVEEKCLAFA